MFYILNQCSIGYFHYLIGIVDLLAFQEVICVRKTNIKLYSLLMRRIQRNPVCRRLFLVSKMLLLHWKFWFLVRYFCSMNCFDRTISKLWNYLNTHYFDTKEMTSSPYICDFWSNKKSNFFFLNCKKLITGSTMIDELVYWFWPLNLIFWLFLF